jgi:uncharacterized protein YdaU (DUF1376 family)
MSNAPFMPLWVSDFVTKTVDLDARETGAYLLLIMALWSQGGTLPNDPRKLQRIARCGREWSRVWGAIERFFTVDGDTISQRRVTEELQKMNAKREVMRANGARGGRAKALKNKETDLANATDLLKQPEPESEDTNPNGLDAEGVDFAKILFERGVAFLERHGVGERQARSLIGKWRKDHSDKEVFNAFADAAKAGVTEPVAWIEARFHSQRNVLSFDQMMEAMRNA